MATPAAATPAPAGAGTAVSTGTGKPAADSSKPAAEAKDEEEDEVVAEEADPRDDDINEQAAKLHAYLSRLETPQLKVRQTMQSRTLHAVFELVPPLISRAWSALTASGCCESLDVAGRLPG